MTETLAIALAADRHAGEGDSRGIYDLPVSMAANPLRELWPNILCYSAEDLMDLFNHLMDITPDAVVDIIKEASLKLPAPGVIFTVPIEKSSEYDIIFIRNGINAGESEVLDLFLIIRADGGPDAVVFQHLGEMIPAENGRSFKVNMRNVDDQKEMDNARMAANLTLFMLGCISMPRAFEQVEVQVPRPIRRRFEKATGRKHPMQRTIRLGKIKMYSGPSGSNEAGETHRRLHLVRGHTRHYRESGRTTWVDWHWRGDPALGVVPFRNKIKAGTIIKTPEGMVWE